MRHCFTPISLSKLARPGGITRRWRGPRRSPRTARFCLSCLTPPPLPPRPVPLQATAICPSPRRPPGAPAVVFCNILTLTQSTPHTVAASGLLENLHQTMVTPSLGPHPDFPLLEADVSCHRACSPKPSRHRISTPNGGMQTLPRTDSWPPRGLGNCHMQSPEGRPPFLLGLDLEKVR